MGRDPKFICQKPAPKNEQPQVLANLRSVHKMFKCSVVTFLNKYFGCYEYSLWYFLHRTRISNEEQSSDDDDDEDDLGNSASASENKQSETAATVAVQPQSDSAQ